MMNVELTELENGTELYAEADTGNKQWVAEITDTHPKYNYEREFIAYQKPKTSKRDSGRRTLAEGAVVESVRYTHSGKNDSRAYYQLVAGELHEIDETDVTLALESIVVDVGPSEETIAELCELEGVGESRAVALADAGFESIDAVENADASELEAVDGIGPATAETLTSDEGEDYERAVEASSEPVAVADGGEDDVEPTRYHADDETPRLTDVRPGDRIDTAHAAPYDVHGRDLESALKNGGVEAETGQMTSQGRPETAFRSLIVVVEAPQSPGSDVNEGLLYDAATDHYARAIRWTDPMSWAEKAWTIKEIGNELEFVPRVDADAMFDRLEDSTDRGREGVLTEVRTFWANAAAETWLTDSNSMDSLTVYEMIFSGGALSVSTDAYPEPEFDGMRAAAEKFDVTFDVELSQTPVEPWELRALELVQNGVFDSMPETAKAWALTEAGHNQTEIANVLGVGQSTVSKHVSRAKGEIERAKWTAANVSV